MPQPLRAEQVVLASTAKWRSDILTQLGIAHRVITPRFTETPFDDGSVEDHAQQMARGKAESLARDFPNALIIAADQLCVLDYDVLGKPGDLAVAKGQLQRLQGRQHRLVTGLSMIYKGRRMTRLDEAYLTMRPLNEKEIDFYLKADNPIFACGAYRIESLGLSLFTEIDARDPHSVTGLPSCLLIEMISGLGLTNLA